VTYGPHE